MDTEEVDQKQAIKDAKQARIERKKLLKAKKLEQKLLKQKAKRDGLNKDRLERNVKLADVNILQVEKRYYKLLLKIKNQRIKEDLKLQWQSFEKIIDYKDFKIQILMDQIQQAKDKSIQQCASHIERIEIILKLFKDRVQDRHDEYMKSVENLFTKKRLDELDIAERQFNDELLLKIMMFNLETVDSETRTHLESKFRAICCEEENASFDQLDLFRAFAERKMEYIWRNFKKSFNEIRRVSDGHRKHYNLLLSKEEFNMGNTAGPAKRTEALIREIKVLREEYITLHNLREKKIESLQIEKEYFQNIYLYNKNQISKLALLDKNQLKQLVGKSNISLKYLRTIIKKGENIFKLISINRKMETLEEKIVPFPENTDNELSESDETDNHEQMIKKRIRSEMEETKNNFDKLMLCISHVEINRQMLLIDKKTLESENELLKHRLGIKHSKEKNKSLFKSRYMFPVR